MPKFVVFILVLIVIVVYSLFIYVNSPHKQVGYRPGNWPQADTAINQAKYLYELKKAQGADLSSGPCLSNDVTNGWVADLVHNPRMPEDNLLENQCVAFLEGRAKHFVELDLNGNLVRAQ